MRGIMTKKLVMSEWHWPLKLTRDRTMCRTQWCRPRGVTFRACSLKKARAYAKISRAFTRFPLAACRSVLMDKFWMQTEDMMKEAEFHHHHFHTVYLTHKMINGSSVVAPPAPLAESPKPTRCWCVVTDQLSIAVSRVSYTEWRNKRNQTLTHSHIQ